MYKIEKNIPIECSGAVKQKYPFGEMDVGDSFFLSRKRMQLAQKPQRTNTLPVRIGNMPPERLMAAFASGGLRDGPEKSRL